MSNNSSRADALYGTKLAYASARAEGTPARDLPYLLTSFLVAAGPDFVGDAKNDVPVVLAQGGAGLQRAQGKAGSPSGDVFEQEFSKYVDGLKVYLKGLGVEGGARLEALKKTFFFVRGMAQGFEFDTQKIDEQILTHLRKWVKKGDRHSGFEKILKELGELEREIKGLSPKGSDLSEEER